jgi:hypothetical protein
MYLCVCMTCFMHIKSSVFSQQNCIFSNQRCPWRSGNQCPFWDTQCPFWDTAVSVLGHWEISANQRIVPKTDTGGHFLWDAWLAQVFVAKTWHHLTQNFSRYLHWKCEYFYMVRKRRTWYREQSLCHSNLLPTFSAINYWKCTIYIRKSCRTLGYYVLLIMDTH